MTGHGGGSRRTCLCLLTRALGSCLPAIHGRFSLSLLEILHAPSSASLFTSSALGRSLASCLTAMEREKRKRDDDAGTIVTFYAPDRAFSRVYKGAFSHCVLPLPATRSLFNHPAPTRSIAGRDEGAGKEEAGLGKRRVRSFCEAP